jgi:rhamnogalacturonan endolyase
MEKEITSATYVVSRRITLLRRVSGKGFFNYLLLFSIFFLFPILNYAQVHEKIDRGVIALCEGERAVFVSWRLLKEDPENVAFNVYRKDIGFGEYKKVNETPVIHSTNFLDESAEPGHGYNYRVKTVIGTKEKDTPGEAYVFTRTGSQPWISIKLHDNVTLKRVGIGDLDGDGAYDFVLQSPDFNVDPYYRPGYWKRSPETYKLRCLVVQRKVSLELRYGLGH